MELDKRIIDGKKPLDCIDAESESVKSFIGKKGYFANHISEFIDISDLEEDVLTAINPDEPDCEVYKATCTTWEYFLPAEWVKEPEKKYRPFTLAEWVDQHEIGDIIHYRCKSQKIELRHMYMGYAHGIGTDIKNTTSGTLTLGVASYCLDYLFEDYEIEVDGKWQPFGVIDE